MSPSVDVLVFTTEDESVVTVVVDVVFWSLQAVKIVAIAATKNNFFMLFV